MTTNRADFVQRYREVFATYLEERDEHARNRAYELGRSAVAQDRSVLDLAAAHQREGALEAQLNELAALYRVLRPPAGSLRMTATDLDRHRAEHALSEPAEGAWEPRGWLAAPLTTLDGRQLGLIQALDKQTG